MGTRTYGVFRHKGGEWRHYDMGDSIVDNDIVALLEAGDETVWVATKKGMSRFDGRTWVTDALPSDLSSNLVINGLHEAPNGSVWLNYHADDWFSQRRESPESVRDGSHGLWTTRYAPIQSPPETTILFYLDKVPYPSNAPVSWSGADLWNNTVAEELLYSHRIDGGEWSPFARYTTTVLRDLSPGVHTLEIKARDLDFNEDPTPAVAHFKVLPPVWKQRWFVALMVVLGCGAVALARVTLVSRNRWKALRRAERTMMEHMLGELQTAHEMQMNLMPVDQPDVSGFRVSGKCIPAELVGEDFFQYFQPGGNLVIAMADVTGHAMEAAIPVVMFSGILDSQMELGGRVEDLFGRLNRSLFRNLASRTFVCFVMGELDPVDSVLRMSNGGCPYPYHFRASTGEVLELQVDAYPLGIRADTAYEVIETTLESGDRVVFCSDGIIECENEDGELFGYEGTMDCVRDSGRNSLSAAATVDRILSAVRSFRGASPQKDDMTCVVLEVS